MLCFHMFTGSFSPGLVAVQDQSMPMEESVGHKGIPRICRKRNTDLQEQARKIVTLKEVEPLIEKQLSGPKGSVEGAAAAAVESHLHQEAYQEGELQELLGTELTSLFQGNKSQLRSVEFAKKNGKPHISILCPRDFVLQSKYSTMRSGEC